jgi:hypothetical protein
MGSVGCFDANRLVQSIQSFRASGMDQGSRGPLAHPGRPASRGPPSPSLWTITIISRRTHCCSGPSRLSVKLLCSISLTSAYPHGRRIESNSRKLGARENRLYFLRLRGFERAAPSTTYCCVRLPLLALGMLALLLFLALLL